MRPGGQIKVRRALGFADGDTYIVQVGFHVNEGEGLLEEDDQHPGGNAVVVEAVLVHVGFLREHETRVLEACRVTTHGWAHLPDSLRY